MDEKGLPRSAVLKELEIRLQRDLAYASGKIFRFDVH